MTAGVSELKSAAPPGAPNAKSGITRPNPFQFVIIGGIALIGALLIMQAYWPGVMIDDARWQYQQALDNAYENWHPPLMAWIWRKLTVLEPGPSPMLVLQLAFYWTGIALIASSAHHRGHPRLAFLLLCAGFLPAPFALSGPVTKDALMDGILLFSTGMILWRQHIWSRVMRSLIVVLAIVGLAFAAALRFNAFFACIPLFLAAIPGSWIRTSPRFLAAVVGSALLFLAIPGLIAAVLHAEDTDVQLSLIIFDLGGITEHSKVSQFPDLNVRNPVAVNHHCYDPKGWDSYSSWAKTPCPLGFDPFQSLIDNGDVNAKDLWVHSILHHPIAYLEHRLTHFNLSTWFFVASGIRFDRLEPVGFKSLGIQGRSKSPSCSNHRCDKRGCENPTWVADLLDCCCPWRSFYRTLGAPSQRPACNRFIRLPLWNGLSSRRSCDRHALLYVDVERRRGCSAPCCSGKSGREGRFSNEDGSFLQSHSLHSITSIGYCWSDPRFVK